VLADNLAMKLAHHVLYERSFALQREVDASRRLVALGSFAAAIAHDIRTPLTSVKMNLQMLRAYRDLDDDMRESADIALEEVHRMNDYVSGILDYAKPVQLCSSETDLSCLIEETARTLQPLLEARKLALQCNVAESCALPRVRADASRMKQVLVNLLENAADASAPGAVISISAGAVDSDHVEIRVSDQGHGIEAINLTKVFEPFFTTRKEGTGLGLAIVRKLVRAHDGEVRVDSALGSGSTFTVLLPA
jgi:signal transduction histidine kinase